MEVRLSALQPRLLCYHVRESDALPMIDCQLSIKRVLFPSIVAQRRINGVLYRIKKPSAVLLIVAITCNFMHFLVKKEIGRWIGIGSITCGIIPITTGLISMRYDMVRLLARTYEFVYVTTLQVLAVALAHGIYGDLRVLSFATIALGNQVAIMIDASTRAVAKKAAISYVSPIASCVYVVFLSLRMIDGFVRFSIYSRGDWTLDSSDILLNALATIALIVGRNSYRRQRQNKALKEERAVNRCRCVGYYTRLEYVQGPYVPQNWYARTRTMSSSLTVSQLRLVPLLGTMEARHVVSRTLFGRVCSTQVFSRCERWCLHAMAIAGVGGSLVGVVGLVTSHPYSHTLALVSLGATCIYCSMSFLHCNNTVLRRLATTFDFLFFVLQLIAAYLYIGYMYHWDRQCLAVLTSGLWLAWIATADALTPVMKRKLGITRTLMLFVMGTQVVTTVALFVGIVFFHVENVENRIMGEVVVFQRRVVWRSLPFLFSRMVTVCPWSVRLLWRIWWMGENTLLMIQGAVEYEDKMQTIRTRQRQQQSVTLAPVAETGRDTGQRRISLARIYPR